jgi:protein SCO1
MATPPPPSAQQTPSGKGPNVAVMLLAAAALALAVAAAALAVTGGKGSTRTTAAVAQGPAPSRYAGSLASPAAPEPPLALHNYKGEEVSVARYRGKAVFVTFIYTHCPDVCPVIASNLGVALNLMGPKQAARAQVIAVSVDPRGDTPATVASFLRRHGVLGRMQYLIGGQRQLARVWRAWGVGSERDAGKPEFVNHSGLVYGISASGKVTTLYASNFRPQEIVHDAPLLASS